MMAFSRFVGLTAIDCTRPPLAALAMTPSPASGIFGGIWRSGVATQPNRRTTAETMKARDNGCIVRPPHARSPKAGAPDPVDHLSRAGIRLVDGASRASPLTEV